jgi:alkylated DNA repair dioxygenase AlkB
VTVSLGEGRVFRLSHPGRKLTRDFPAEAGTVFVMPYDTNLAWKHAVPRFARHRGRRISLTFRAFIREVKM